MTDLYSQVNNEIVSIMERQVRNLETLPEKISLILTQANVDLSLHYLVGKHYFSINGCISDIGKLRRSQISYALMRNKDLLEISNIITNTVEQLTNIKSYCLKVINKQLNACLPDPICDALNINKSLRAEQIATAKRDFNMLYIEEDLKKINLILNKEISEKLLGM